MQAFVDNNGFMNQTELAIATIRKSGRVGISAKEYAEYLGVCCTHQPRVSSRLSDALKRCDDIEYVVQEGESSGRYIAKPKPNKFGVGKN